MPDVAAQKGMVKNAINIEESYITNLRNKF